MQRKSVGLDGDRGWAGLKHYTPGLKMDPTPALPRGVVGISHNINNFHANVASV